MHFEWDSNNLQHILTDHPERENTVDEVESIFYDPSLIIKVGRREMDEQRFTAVGIGNSQIVKHVVFTISNGLIRPVSCWQANRQTTRYYYENTQDN